MTSPSTEDEGKTPESLGTCTAEGALDGAQILEESEFRRTVFSRLLEQLHRRFGAERAVAVFTTEESAIRLKAAHNLSVIESRETPPVISRTIVNDVVERRAPVLIQDALDNPILEDQTSVMEQGVRSVMCVPLLAAGEVLGVIYMDNLSESGKFTPEDLETLNLVSSCAAASLHGAELVQEPARPDPNADEDAFGTVTAGMAHDFKNVLSAIQIRLRLSQEANQQLQTDLARAHDAVELGREHVMQIADYSQVCSTTEARTVNLADVLREALDVMQDVIQQEETSYEFDLDIPDSALLHGHRAQLREVCINLLSNALDAMGKQGKLTVSVRRGVEEWIVKIGDSGHGIREEHQEQLFEPFFTTKGKNGMGLGLTMVRSVVDSHGGSVSAKSPPGEGTVVTVRLPTC